MERSHLGKFLELFGLSLWKLAISLGNSVLLLISNGTFPNVSAIAVLYPSMVDGRLSFSLKRKHMNSHICFIEGDLKSTCCSMHHLSKTDHFEA